MGSAVVMIHGRGPKPGREALLECWKGLLPRAARDLSLDMVSWVDLFGYTPAVLSGPAADCAHIAAADLPDASAQALLTAVPDETLEELQRELSGGAWSWSDVEKVKDRAVELIWTRFATVSRNQFALDVLNFFRDRPALRTDSRARLRAAIRRARDDGHEVCVVAHSFGTVVAYEAARELREREIHTLITMGGPLAWCYDMWTPAAPAPTADYLEPKEFPRFGVQHWWNVYDPADLVATAKVAAVAPQIGPAYRSAGRAVIVDAPIVNGYAQAGHLGSPHDYRGYLDCEPVRRAMRLFMLETGAGAR